jgi:N-glycosylase/DNA lyase
MNRLPLEKFHADRTLLGGQTFSWEKTGDAYYGATSERVIKLVKKRDYYYWQTYPQKDDFEFIERYFRVDLSDRELIIHAESDNHLRSALELFPGLHLLHQDFEDTLISFVISQNSNIPKIKRSVKLLREKFGNVIEVDGVEHKLFPSIESLSSASIEELRSLGLGYRAEYVHRICQVLGGTIDRRNAVDQLDYEQARDWLLGLHGVGEKVAGCILVFALSHDHITPLDVWAKRVLVDLYGIDPRMKYSDMLDWLQNKFGSQTSLAGQYLFEYYRSIDKK